MAFQPSRTLRSRTFIGLILSQILAAFNDQAIHIVAIFYANDVLVRYVRLHGQLDIKVVIAVVTACFITPFALFSPLAGMLADKYSKRTTLILWKLAEVGITALALVGFLLPHTHAWFGWSSLPTLYTIGAILVVACVFLMGMHSAFFVPAKYGVMPEILHPSVLSRGNGILEATSFLSQIIGTVSGGLLYALCQSEYTKTGNLENLGREWIIGVILFGLALIGAVGSFLIQRMPPADPDRPLTWKLWQPLRRNIATLLRSRPLALAVLGIAFFAFVVLFARQTLLYDGEIHKDFDKASAAVVAVNKAVQAGKDPKTALESVEAGETIAEPQEGEPAVTLWDRLSMFLFGGKGDDAKEAELKVAMLIALVGLGIGLGSPLAGYLSGTKVELGLVPLGAVALILSTAGLAVFIKSEWGLFLCLVLTGISAGFYIVPLYTLLQHRAPKDSKGNLVATSNFVNVVGGLVAIGAFYAVTKGLDWALHLGLSMADVKAAAPEQVPQVLADYVTQLQHKQSFTRVLFLTASAMTLLTLLLLCIQLPDFFVRTMLFLRKVFGRGLLGRATVHAVGVNNLPSEGPVILATNCDRPEKCMLVLGATDRVIRFLLLENTKEERLPLLLRIMVRPISLAVLKPQRQTPRALKRATEKAVDVLARGEVVGLPPGVPGGVFDLDEFLRHMRQEVPEAGVVPVYYGPGEPVGMAGRDTSKVWIAFGEPLERPLSAREIRDRITQLGRRVREMESSPGLSGETPKASTASLLERGEDLPGHP